MITPMTGDGAVDYDGAARLAEYLVTDMRNDGLVISGTTGESPTTTDDEKDRLLRAVIEAVGDRVPVVAGVGTNDTAHSLRAGPGGRAGGRHRAAGGHPVLQQAPADRPGRRTSPRSPTRPGCRCCSTTSPAGRATADRDRHAAPAGRAPADRGGQGRQGATCWPAPRCMARTGLAYYCGDDPLNLPWLSVGACGFVSVHAHVIGDRLHELIEAYFERPGRRRAGHPPRGAPGLPGHDQGPGRDHGQGGAEPARACPAARSGCRWSTPRRRRSSSCAQDLTAGGVKIR